jgi:Fe-S-cluster formation regulator IscX/YfhJ
MKWKFFTQLVKQLDEFKTDEDREKIIELIQKNWKNMDWYAYEVVIDKMTLTEENILAHLSFVREFIQKAEVFENQFSNLRTKIRFEYLKEIIHELDQRDQES